MKEAGAPSNINDLLAEKAVKEILSHNLFAEDFDEACEMGGSAFRQIIDEIVESPVFQSKVKKMIGSKYNEEFFLDGYNKGMLRGEDPQNN